MFGRGQQMKNLLRIVAATAILACAQASAGLLFAEGRLVQWIPNSEITEPVSAAFDQNGIPVVLYSPGRLRSLELVQGKFLLLRQEYVALLARSALRKSQPTQGTSRNQAKKGPIDEQSVYRFMPPGIDPSGMLDCIAVHSLHSIEQAELARTLRRTKKGFVVWPTDRILTADEVVSMRTRKCEPGLPEYR